MQIEYVELENGKTPFLDFLDSLSEGDIVKVFARIDFLIARRELGKNVSPKLSKLLRDGIFELKCELTDRTTRIFYFFVKRSRMVITHGFIKKTQKTPGSEIERAIRLRKSYEGRLR